MLLQDDQLPRREPSKRRDHERNGTAPRAKDFRHMHLGRYKSKKKHRKIRNPQLTYNSEIVTMADSQIPKTRFRTVTVDQLEPGMFIYSLRKRWLHHSFWKTHFLVRDRYLIERIRLDGIQEVIIDTSRGKDLLSQGTPTQESELEPPTRVIDKRQFALNLAPASDLADEQHRMRIARKEMVSTVQTLMHDVRLGNEVQVDCLNPVVDKILDSISRHPDALTSLLRLKTHSQYAYEHSLCVSALSIAIALTLKISTNQIREIALGALLHDIGKAHIPKFILDKPGPLNSDETKIMRQHVVKAVHTLEGLPGVSRTTIECVQFHHERLDGSGYPLGITGNKIPSYTQIVSIADTYDAMTSDRCYKKGVEPSYALNLLHAIGERHYSVAILDALTIAIGVYPVGSLVRLNNGHLAVVTAIDRHNPRAPTVQVIFNTRERSYIPPYELVLSRRFESPKVVGVESFESWKIDRQLFL